MHKEHHGFLYGILAALTSSLSSVFIKSLANVPTSTIVFFRFLIALICISPWIYRNKVHIHWSRIKIHFVRAVTGLISIASFFYSVQHLPLVNSMTLSSTSPLFMPLVVLFWGKLIVPRSRFWALLVGFIGVVVILRPGAQFSGLATYVGLIGGFFSAIALYGVRMLSKSESTETILTYYFLIATVVALPFAAVEARAISLHDTALLALIGVTTFGYQYLITKSYTHAPATKVSVMNYLSVIFSGLFGWWLFEEVPDNWVLLGALFIIAGGILALFAKGTARPWRR